MLFTGTYMLNMLCAIVPCQATMRPPEAYISDTSDFIGPLNISKVDPKFPAGTPLQRPKRLEVAPGSTTVKYPNLVNPARILMDAFRKGMDQGGKYTLNFGNKMIPFPEKKRGSTGGGNAKRNVDHEFGGNDTVVYLRNGDAVQGYFMGTMKGRRIVGFQGIPYAEPPVGHLRLRAPVPKRPWHGMLQATRPGSECLQGHPINFFRISGSEDCLHLSVYTPTQNLSSTGQPRSLFPVLFFIHGGSFMYGSEKEYGPAYLLDENIVLVSVNYRLGALGFLSTGDAESPGNFGLKDQQLALKWVYDNIEQFGGDPKKITILGQSAGGISAHLQLLSNQTNSLIQGGISLSGSASGFWPVVPRSRALGFTRRLAEAVRCPAEDTRKMVECLRRLNPNRIIGAQLHFFKWIPFHPLIVFGPVVEPKVPGAFLTKSPDELYAAGEVEPKPWIFGQTSQEGHFETYLVNLFMQTPVMSARVKNFLPVILDYEFFTREPERRQISEKVVKFYGAQIENDNPRLMDVVSDMYTDRIFTNGIQQSIRTHSQIAPTFAYIFDFMGTTNLGQVFGAAKSEWGVVHTEDLFFLFNSSVFHDGFRRRDPGYKLSQIMTNLVANFAKFGEPLYTDDNGQNIKIWDPAVSLNATKVQEQKKNLPIRYLQLNRVVEMTDDPFTERNLFWKSLNLRL